MKAPRAWKKEEAEWTLENVEARRKMCIWKKK
jgi:hypothetical protein